MRVPGLVRAGFALSTLMAAAFSAAPARAAQALPVTSCGQVLQDAKGVLAADLDCSATTAVAVRLERSSLDLGGFTVTGSASASVPTIRCIDACAVAGPGTVAGGLQGIAAFEIPGKVSVRGVTVRDGAGSGVVGAVVLLRDTTITHNGLATGACGVFSGARITKAIRSTITGNACGIWNHGKRPAVVRNSMIVDNLPAAPAVNQRLFGVFSLAGLRASDSTIAGHVANVPPFGPWCDYLACGDIVTFQDPPVLREVVCDVSVNATSYPLSSWNLCAKDTDFDQDGTPNETDGCDFDATCASEDTDADGLGDCCDNCVDVADELPVDYDNDGIGNVCDSDIDGDGTGNELDLCPLNGFCTTLDTDGDGVGNCCDNCWDVSNPDQADSDHDGFADACDNCPDVYNGQADKDQDGIGDACE